MVCFDIVCGRSATDCYVYTTAWAEPKLLLSESEIRGVLIALEKTHNRWSPLIVYGLICLTGLCRPVIPIIFVQSFIFAYAQSQLALTLIFVTIITI